MHKIVNSFLPNNFNMCFVCSKELSRGEGSFEYPQHMFQLRNKKHNFQLGTLKFRFSFNNLCAQTVWITVKFTTVPWEYSKCSKILNISLFLFSNEMVVIRAGNDTMLVRIAIREDPG